MKLISWNVNGIRAAFKKGLKEVIRDFGADIVCIQEVKAHLEQLEDDIAVFDDYHFYLASGSRKGYSGVAVYSKIRPIAVQRGFEDTPLCRPYNDEGRVIRLEFEDFYLYNIYFPNGASTKERRDYKEGFNCALLEELKELKKKNKGIIICGDVNIAHEDIDLKNPQANAKHSGFLPSERRFIDKLLDLGFIDSFRWLNPELVKYSWWSYRFNARKTNAGWRIDYFFVSDNLKDKVVGADVLDGVLGSDHAPIELLLDLK